MIYYVIVEFAFYKTCDLFKWQNRNLTLFYHVLSFVWYSFKRFTSYMRNLIFTRSMQANQQNFREIKMFPAMKVVSLEMGILH